MTRLGFVGGGNMAEALVSGILKAKLVEPKRIWVSDPREDRRKHMEARYKVNASKDNLDIARECDTVIIAVKPQQVKEVLEELSEVVDDRHLIITIAAGITTAFVGSLLRRSVPVIRVMPNTPACVQEAATAVAPGQHARQAHIDNVLKVFNSVGSAVVVDESQMDAVTALSGSGPAYVFYLIEAMVEAGQAQGLSAEVARELATQTVCGAASMALQTMGDPVEMRKKVTSPGGTTEKAIAVLESRDWKGALAEAVKAARERSEELSKQT